MPTPTLELSMKYLTAPQVQKRLSLSRYQLDVRIERGIFPRPILVAPSGVRYFDDDWVRVAQTILANAMGRLNNID